MVLIDDARMFQGYSKCVGDFGTECYPTLDDLREVLCRRQPTWSFLVEVLSLLLVQDTKNLCFTCYYRSALPTSAHLVLPCRGTQFITSARHKESLLYLLLQKCSADVSPPGPCRGTQFITSTRHKESLLYLLLQKCSADVSPPGPSSSRYSVYY